MNETIPLPPAVATATTRCGTCSALIHYEPIMTLGRDLARCLHQMCPACQDAAEARERAAAEDARRLEIRQRILNSLPPELLPREMDADGTDLYHPDFPLGLWRQIQQWRPGPRGNWLALVGPAGLCKTRLLALMAERIMQQGIRLVWTTAVRLHAEAGNLRSHERALSTRAREHLADCLHAPWLIIDDLGKNEWSPAFESQLFQILDHRKNHRLPLAYSSNASPEGFSQVISPLNSAPIIGRLTDRTTMIDFSA